MFKQRINLWKKMYFYASAHAQLVLVLVVSRFSVGNYFGQHSRNKSFRFRKSTSSTVGVRALLLYLMNFYFYCVCVCVYVCVCVCIYTCISARGHNSERARARGRERKFWENINLTQARREGKEAVGSLQSHLINTPPPQKRQSIQVDSKKNASFFECRLRPPRTS